jgi:hypothetical protein
MADNDGGKKMNNNWIDVSKTDAVIVIVLAAIVFFLMYLGMQMAPTGMGVH